MSTSESLAVAAPRQRWIVSAGWDLGYVVLTPLMIVPAVLILVRRVLTPEEISLAVIAFASLGHHLPGFMRAYGDRELFARYRWRFLLCPLMVLGLALLFTPPTALSEAFGLPWQHMHGLELVLLFWGTWHGLMQTYGFMRIYDVRMGIDDRWGARLDHWLCLMVFIAGVVFSDARVFGIAQGMWQSGLPLFGPEWLRWTRLLVGGVGLSVLIAYLLYIATRYRRGEPVSWLKLVLIGTTGWFYWYTGQLSTNVLVGLAMFEIYHAVQYDAIVWIYNRRLMQRAGERFGPLGFLFRDRWTMLCFYLAAIGAYSSIRFFSVDSSGYLYRGTNQDTHRWLMAFFVSSSLLHFYFDGFIWKVSEKKTQENLLEGDVHTGIAQRMVPGLLHAAKWLVLLLIAAGLLYTEWSQPWQQDRRAAKRLAALAALTPELPECQSLLCRAAISRGDAQSAIEHAEKTLALRPRSQYAHADLGLGLMLAGRLEEARQAFEDAIEIEPSNWSYYSNLGMILSRLGDTTGAEKSLRTAIDLQPELVDPRQHLIDFYLRQERGGDADRVLQEMVQLFPSSFTSEAYQVLTLSSEGKFEQATRLACYLVAGGEKNWRAQYVLGVSLNASREGQFAIAPLARARQLQPLSPLVRYQLGMAYFLMGKPEEAVVSLRNAVRLDPQHFAAQFQLANALFVLKKTDAAIAAYQRCFELQPSNAMLCANYGGLLAQHGRKEEAEKIYRSGLSANPDSGRLNYNLGILLLGNDRRDEAEELLMRAKELGVEIPGNVRAALEKQ